MIIHAIVSAAGSFTQGEITIDATIAGVRANYVFGLSSADNETNAGLVRTAVQAWLDAGNSWAAISGPTIDELRASATVSRSDFLKACVTAGIITSAVAKEAATGNWPTAFNTFIDGLSDDQQIDAITTWTDARQVRRTAPILALIAANQGVNDATLDTMFGISA